MRVFISSVRRGLEQERDALRGLLLALGHEPLRFEDFTAQPVPSREACLEGARAADVYLLLLGPYYGDPLPETGRSPTDEEHVAALTKGIPRLVFVKQGSVLEPRQAEFRKEVESYSTGLFLRSFTDAVDLQPAVAAALRESETRSRTLSWVPLAQPVEVQWVENWSLPQARRSDGAVLEVHAIPVEASVLSARQLRDMGDSLAARLRNLGAVETSVAVDAGADAGAAWACPAPPPHGMWNRMRPEALLGVRVGRSGQRSAWQTLPADGLGSLLDPADLADRLARLLRLMGSLLPLESPQYAIAVGLSPTTMVSLGSTSSIGTRTSATMAASGHSGVKVPPDEAVFASGLVEGAGEVASALSRALLSVFPRL